jgi:hypothetical protein
VDLQIEEAYQCLLYPGNSALHNRGGDEIGAPAGEGGSKENPGGKNVPAKLSVLSSSLSEGPLLWALLLYRTILFWPPVLPPIVSLDAFPTALSATSNSIHPSAWEKYSPKSICRTVNRTLVLRRIRPLLTLRTQTSDHHVLRVRIKKCSDQYAASRQDDDTGEGYQELRPRVHYGRYVLPAFGVCTRRFEGVIYGQARRALETTSFA